MFEYMTSSQIASLVLAVIFTIASIASTIFAIKNFVKLNSFTKALCISLVAPFVAVTCWMFLTLSFVEGFRKEEALNLLISLLLALFICGMVVIVAKALYNKHGEDENQVKEEKIEENQEVVNEVKEPLYLEHHTENEENQNKQEVLTALLIADQINNKNQEVAEEVTQTEEENNEETESDEIQEEVLEEETEQENVENEETENVEEEIVEENVENENKESLTFEDVVVATVLAQELKEEIDASELEQTNEEQTIEENEENETVEVEENVEEVATEETETTETAEVAEQPIEEENIDEVVEENEEELQIEEQTPKTQEELDDDEFDKFLEALAKEIEARNKKNDD